MWRSLFLVAFLCFVRQGFAKEGCPPAEDTKPCVCFGFGLLNFLCQNVTDPEELRNAIVKSEGYKYERVSIVDSDMEYLPHEMLENLTINELYLTRVKLTSLFDQEPDDVNKLKELHLNKFELASGLSWEILKPWKDLRRFSIRNMTVSTLDSTFSDNAPKQLMYLELRDTKIENIRPGALGNLTRLQSIKINGGRISIVKRSIFPKPFNGRVIELNDQNLKKIPAGCFRDMPHLESVSLMRNHLSTLQEEVFDNASQLRTLRLDSNQLKCDCSLKYLVDLEDIHLSGKCKSPKKLHGRHLNTLKAEELNC